MPAHLMTLNLPCLGVSHKGLQPHFACTAFVEPGLALVVLEAPNWGTALRWGEAAALQAWMELNEQFENLPEPSDAQRFVVLLVRPGYPLAGVKLWEESFSYYLPVPRAPTLVYRLTPLPGTAQCAHCPLLDDLSDLLAGHGLAHQQLQRYGRDGLMLSPSTSEHETP